MSELKPCPFCEYDNVRMYDRGNVVCQCCHAENGGIGWNNRPIEDNLRIQLSELKDKLKLLEGALLDGLWALDHISAFDVNSDSHMQSAKTKAKTFREVLEWVKKI